MSVVFSLKELAIHFYVFCSIMLAYAGLVNSTWQPAGWTVACEALASGLPIVLYKGLVSNELNSLGCCQFLHSISMGDTQAFKIKLESLVSQQKSSIITQEIQNFAAKNLDLEKTAESFIKEIAYVWAKPSYWQEQTIGKNWQW